MLEPGWKSAKTRSLFLSGRFGADLGILTFYDVSREHGIERKVVSRFINAINCFVLLKFA